MDRESKPMRQIASTISSLFSGPPYESCQAADPSDSNKRIFLTFALFIFALLLRSWQNTINPGLYMEDAAHYFNLYYGANRDLSFTLQRPNGYFNILNNLVAWLTARADVRLQPLLYHVFALLMGIGTATLLMFSGLIRKRSIILLLPFVLGFSGMNHIYYYITLTFQMYNVVVLLLCLLLFPPAKSYLTLSVQCLVATLLVWSGPYSVVALPVALMLLTLFRNGRKTILLWTVVTNVALYSLTVRESTIQLQNMFDEGILRIASKTLFEKIFFLDLLGDISFIKVFTLCALLTAVFFALRKDTCYLRLSLLLFAIIIGSLAPLFLSTKYLLYQTVFPCHIYISTYFWLFFLLVSADRLLCRYSDRSVLLPVLMATLFLGTVVLDNVRHPAKRFRVIMQSIPAFVQTIHRVEQLELEKENAYVLVKTENIVPGHMPPLVRVGSQRNDARRLGRNDVPLTLGNEYIVK